MKLPPFWQHLPEDIKARLGRKVPGRQRAMAAEGHLLLVLHRAPGPDQRDREPVYFWREPDGSWDGTRGPGLLHLHQHVAEFEGAEAALAEDYEQAHSAEQLFEILEHVAPLHHSARNLHGALQTAREAAPQDADLIDLRDKAYELERTLELLYEDTRNALNYYMARQTEEETRLSRHSAEMANRLSVLAAIFFPVTALASLFGMNLRSGLEAAPVWAFWALLVAGVLLGFAVSWWVLRTLPAPAARPAPAAGSARRQAARQAARQ